MKIRKITPVLYAHELEPCIKFWSERFGLDGFHAAAMLDDDPRECPADKT